LARIDRLLPLVLPELSRGPGTVLDLGLGALPWTTLEFQAYLADWNPLLALIAADLDDHRLASAAHAPGPPLKLLRCGFDIPVNARLIRAVNLLRQYPMAQVKDAHARMGRALVLGGVLLEGTTDKSGGRFGFHLLRRTPPGLIREALVLGTDFSRGFAPLAMRDYLPRDLRHRVVPKEPLYGFFQDWTVHWGKTRTRDPSESFDRSLEALVQCHPGVCRLAPGVLLWRPKGGIPT
jgi:hypothetical protein